MVAFQINFEDLLICCLPPWHLRKIRVLYRRSHYSYIFFFHFSEHVTSQITFIAEMSKYFPILYPNLLHNPFPLSCFAATKLSSRSFSSSQTLTPSSVLSLHRCPRLCWRLLLPLHPSVMGSPGCIRSASHLFSSCNPNSLFQLLLSPTMTFALASSFLSNLSGLIPIRY